MFPAMKLLLVLGLGAVVTRADRQQVVDFHRPCLDHHGVEDDDLHFALDKLKIRDDDEFYLHFFCVAKQGKLMTEDGTVETDDFETKMKGIIDEDNMENVAAIVRMCLIQRDTVLETIRNAVDCFLGKDHKL
uniref:Odorant binding protein 13a n=1 Tax=Dendroctonus adjunctus TaxID=77157 RepID=A0A7U3MX79_9CUCU|nr:Odorant binding protein 13a [Dendroctonus adjunctus]